MTEDERKQAIKEDRERIIRKGKASAVFFYRRISAAQNSQCPKEWKIADGIDEFLRKWGYRNEGVEALKRTDPGQATKAAVEVVSWGNDNKEDFQWLFKRDRWEEWCEWACAGLHMD